MNENDRQDGLPEGRFFSDDQIQLPEGKPVNPVAVGCLTYAGLKFGCLLTMVGLVLIARLFDTLLGRHPWSDLDSLTVVVISVVALWFLLAIRRGATKS
jgi:hypothetical protein